MAQTVKPFEVLVVDNNCRDKTVEIASNFPSVKVVHEPRQGLFFSRERGMNAAKGDILCRIDADTILDMHWVENVLKIFGDTRVQAATGPMGYHDFIFPEVSRAIEHCFLLGARALGYKFVFGCNMAIRRAAWQSIMDELCDDTNIFEDIDIAMHLRQHGLQIMYDRRLAAMVSIRRAEDNPIDFCRYIGGHSYTADKHNTPLPPARYAEASFLLGYGISKPLLMCYDTHERRFTRRKLLGQVISARRDNPMSPAATPDKPE
ncbi:MAG: hypothetical protein QG629_174 [Patescibacteria group bacterium]|nr:hypothetical protein [Patescibacteria group bacterium]